MESGFCHAQIQRNEMLLACEVFVIDDLQAHYDRRWMIRGWAVFCRGGNGIISQACGIACPVALTVWTI
jgi:hypothetical protein